MDSFCAAVIQLNSQADIAANLRQCESYIEAAADAGAQLILLPECFAFYGISHARTLELARQEQTPAGPIRTWLAKVARRYQVWLVAGSVAVAASDSATHSYGRCFVYDSDGQERGVYDKIHLFDVDVDDVKGCYRESAYTLPGQSPVVIATPWGKMGLSICYDLRFPELFRALLDHGAEWICVPAAFTRVTGKQHWKPLLQARAIENQCFVMAAAQVGVHPDQRETWGHSLMIDPWGRTLAEAGEEPGWLVAEFNRQVQVQTRSAIPCLHHRKL